MENKENPYVNLLFKSTHISKVFFGFEEWNLVEIALWDKKNNTLIFVEDTIKIDYKNDNLVSTLMGEKVEYLKFGGIIKRILSKPFGKHLYTKMITSDIKVNFIPEDYYSLVVTSTMIKLNNDVKENRVIYVVGNNCPIELLEYLKDNLKDNQEIQIKKSLEK